MGKITAVGCTVSGCEVEKHYAQGMCQKHYRAAYRARDVKPEPQPLSLEPTTYKQAHKRITQRRGKATEHECVSGGHRAQQWAYKGGSHHEQTGWVSNGGGHFYWTVWSPDPADYQPMCIPCHRAYDSGVRAPVMSR